MKALQLVAIKFWLFLPNSIHKLLAHFLLGLWLFLRPKYLKRLKKRFKYLTGLNAKFTIKESYQSLYFQVLYSYRYQFKIKTPHIRFQIDKSIDIQNDFKSNCLFWSIHYGAFEALHFLLQDLLNENFAYSNTLGVPVSINDGLIKDLRQKQGQSLIDSKQVKKLLSWLHAKKNMALLIDQSPSPILHSIKLNNIKEDSLQSFAIWPELLIKGIKLDYKIYAFNASIKSNEIVFEIAKPLVYNSPNDLYNYIETHVNEWIKNKPEQFVWHYKKTFHF